MLIPEEKVEEVKQATDIVEVVGDYVHLKKRGNSFIGLCPFHSEKTPSFNVTPSLGIYKCFGCGEGGNVFNFLMRVENFGFVETVRMLAERAGIELPAERAAEAPDGETESIYHALRFAARFYYAQLTQTERGRERALSYFLNRGLEPATIKKFGLGYAPPEWDGLLEEAQRNHIPTEILEKAGLIIPRKNQDGYYDRFRDRAMFPIFSHIGKVVGFGGRVLDPDSDQPKYINSPETKVYHKSDILYGLYQSRQEIRGRNEAILVEGYTDVISLHQAGIENVVASSGTALTVAQIKAINRYCDTILLLYDADAAGSAAALRGIDLVLARGMAPYLVALPSGTDPDSFVREEGAESFRKFLAKHRQDFVAFKHRHAQESDGLESPESQARLMQQVLESILHIPSALSREAYIRRAADVLGVPDSVLHREMTRREKSRANRPPHAPPPAPDERPAPADDEREPPAQTGPAVEPLPEEKVLIRLMLEHGNEMVGFVLGFLSLADFTEGVSRETVEGIVGQFHEGEVRMQPFLDGELGDDVQRLASEVFTNQHELSVNWERKRNIPVPRLNDNPRETATSAMQQLRLDRLDEAIKAFQKQLYRAQQNGEDVSNLLLELQEFHRMRAGVMKRSFADSAAE